MLSMQNEQSLKGMDNFFVLGHGTIWSKGHTHKVMNIAQIHIRFHYVVTLEDAHAGRCDRRHLSKHSVDVNISFFLGFIAEITTVISRVRFRMA